MGLTDFQAQLVDSLNAVDKANDDLLNQVVTAAEASLGDEGATDVTADEAKAMTTQQANESGYIKWGDSVGAVNKTSGVALLEAMKDAISTAASNTSGVGANQAASRKIVERKVANA